MPLVVIFPQAVLPAISRAMLASTLVSLFLCSCASPDLRQKEADLEQKIALIEKQNKELDARNKESDNERRGKLPNDTEFAIYKANEELKRSNMEELARLKKELAEAQRQSDNDADAARFLAKQTATMLPEDMRRSFTEPPGAASACPTGHCH